MEVAALISDCCNRVTVIGNSSTPLSVFGDKVGLAVQKVCVTIQRLNSQFLAVRIERCAFYYELRYTSINR